MNIVDYFGLPKGTGYHVLSDSLSLFRAVTISPNNKIIAAGGYFDVGYDFLAARFNDNGTLAGFMR